MRLSSLQRVLVVLLGSSISLLATAQTSDLNVVTSAVPFLRISPDARAGGMGDVGIATNPDANSAFWNLAKTPFTKAKSGISFTYTPWLKDLGLNDVYLASGTGYYKLDDQQVLSASLRYFSLGNIQFTDFAGNDLNSFRPRELGIDIGYSRKLNEKLSLGFAARYISSSLANGTVGGVTYKTGSAVAADISLYHDGNGKDGEGFSYGVVLSNLGSKIGYTNDAQNKDYIPANLGIGVAYTSVFDESNRITFGLDVNRLLVPTPPLATGNTSTDSANLAGYRNKSVISSYFSSFGDAGGFGNELKKFQVSLGAEYVYNEQFAVRAGYFYEDVSQGNRKYFTAGLGLKYNIIGINLSYLIPSGQGITRNPLSNTLRFGISFDLDGNSGK
ncbi:MAG: type IX secretion system outer membrane channel protein PorV [Pedobacter sp.]|nr:type IX secretion system outer membrane channel protein PorV [Chitinophagaceae bacterium]